jgi:large subunit ribosomal protein L34
MFVRTNIRNNFPRAKEGKRIKTHGWKVRINSPGGRKILMRKILKGTHVLSH